MTLNRNLSFIHTVSLSKPDVLCLHSASDFDLSEMVVSIDNMIRLAITDLEAVALRSAMCFLGFEIARRLNSSFSTFNDASGFSTEVEEILMSHLSVNQEEYFTDSVKQPCEDPQAS